jgi:hypothetical protein
MKRVYDPKIQEGAKKVTLQQESKEGENVVVK